MRRTTAFTLTIAGLIALAGAAPTLAQDDLLKGPKARQAGPPGAPAAFAPGEADLREPTPAMRHRLLMAAIATLERDEALALDGAQRQAIEAQDRLYRAALEAYREANAEAYGALRPERPAREGAGDRQREARRDREGARDADGPRRDRERDRAAVDGERPAKRGAERPPMDPEQRGQMRDRMQALRALEMNAPSSAEIDANIWGLLTAEQQQAVERRMERIKAAAGERVQGRRDGQREQAEGERPQRQRRDGEARLTDQQRERIRRAMEDMTPEERRAFMEEMRQRMRERAPGERRPAPPMEEVEVPPPGR